MPGRRALLVAVPQYEPDFPPLPVAVSDARLLGDALSRARYSVDSLGTTGISPSRNQILEAVREFCRTGQTGETLLVYFSGHGLQYEGANYLVPGDVSLRDAAHLQDYLVPLSFADVVDESEADLVLFVIDACREGFTYTDVSKTVRRALRPWDPEKVRAAQRRESAYLFSCAASQYSTFVDGPEGFSLFTKAFAESMHPADPACTLREVLEATQRRLDRLTAKHGKRSQQIRLHGEWDPNGDLVSRVVTDGGQPDAAEPVVVPGCAQGASRPWWRRIPHPAGLENVIDLAEAETHRITVAKRRKWTWLAALGLAFVALVALALVVGTRSPSTFTWWLGSLLTLLVLSIGAVLAILLGQYKRLRHYQEALPEVHHLGHKVRDLLGSDVVGELRSEAGKLAALAPGSTPERDQLRESARVLFRMLAQVMILFGRLANRGEIHVTMLVPSGNRLNGQATHLEVAGWSPTRDTVLPWERRARGANHRKSKLSIAHSLAGYVYERRRSILVRDVDRALARNELPRFEISGTTRSRSDIVKYTRSHMEIPLVASGDVFGVLCIDSTSPYDFHADYIEVGRLCADLLAHVLSLAGYREYPQKHDAVQPRGSASVQSGVLPRGGGSDFRTPSG